MNEYESRWGRQLLAAVTFAPDGGAAARMLACCNDRLNIYGMVFSLTDVIQSLSIVGISSKPPVGVILDPRLEPNPLEILGPRPIPPQTVLTGELRFTRFDALPADPSLTLTTGLPTGAAATTGALPIVQTVKDVLAAATGTLPLSIPAISGALNVTWTVTRSDGSAAQDVKVLNAQSLIPRMLPLPEFTEMTNVPLDLLKDNERQIWCDVQIGSLSRRVGPLTFTMPTIPIPSVVIVTEHPLGYGDYPGSVMAVVPPDSPVASLDMLYVVLDAVNTVLTTLNSALAPFAFAAAVQYSTRKDLLSATLLALTKIVPQGAGFFRGDIPELSFVYHMDDRISSILVLGPPKRTVNFYNNIFFRLSEGAFSVEASDCVAYIEQLHAPAGSGPWYEPARSRLPGSELPPSGKVTVLYPPQVPHWDNTISSHCCPN